MSQIQMMFCSVVDLFDRELWRNYFERLEMNVGSNLSHLDNNDPIRRRVSNLADAAAFVCDISELENSRTLFAKFGKSKVEMTITLYKNTELFANNISIYFPDKFFDNKNNSTDRIHGIFELSNKKIKPFYSLSDSAEIIAGKRKASGFAVNLQEELIGVFWLTFFSTRYVAYFGQQSLVNLRCRSVASSDGMLVRLGDSPMSVDMQREEAERILGKDSFVTPSLDSEKPLGKHALMFNQLID